MFKEVRMGQFRLRDATGLDKADVLSVEWGKHKELLPLFLPAFVRVGWSAKKPKPARLADRDSNSVGLLAGTVQAELLSNWGTAVQASEKVLGPFLLGLAVLALRRRFTR
jgi:hypothetical protein